MSVTIASSSVLAEGTRSTTSSFTAPTGITSGDLLLIWFFEFKSGGIPGGGDATPPTGGGFAAPATGTWPQTAGGGDFASYLWWKIAGSSEPGTYAVNMGASDVTRGIMLRITGANTTTPFDGLTQNSGTTGTSTTTFTGLTTTVDNDLIVALNADDNDAGTYGNTSGGNLTLTLNANTPGESSYSANLATAGATGTITAANRSAAATPWFGVLLAVQPTASTATSIPALTMAPMVAS